MKCRAAKRKDFWLLTKFLLTTDELIPRNKLIYYQEHAGRLPSLGKRGAGGESGVMGGAIIVNQRNHRYQRFRQSFQEIVKVNVIIRMKGSNIQ